jgi:hypothetical protein
MTTNPPLSPTTTIVTSSQFHRIAYRTSAGFYYIAVTNNIYPYRVVCQCLNELISASNDSSSFASTNSSSSALTTTTTTTTTTTPSNPKALKAVLKSVLSKYNEQPNIDALDKVKTQVDSVKRIMEDNVSIMLRNNELASSIDARSLELTEQSKVFKKRSVDLKKRMRCKNMKWNLIMCSLALLVIGIIVVIVVLNVNSGASE